MYDSIDINEIDRIKINSTDSKQENAVVLLDIRDKYEYVLGSIKRSVNIPYNYLALMPENYLNETSTYYIYCDSGNKSRKMCLHLSELGYHVIDLIGGYKNYHKNNSLM